MNFHFHMIFKISLSIFTKKPTGILIGIVLNQCGEFIDIMPMPAYGVGSNWMFQALENVPLFTLTPCLGHRLARAWLERKRPLSSLWDWGHGPGPSVKGNWSWACFLIGVKLPSATCLCDFTCNGLASQLFFSVHFLLSSPWGFFIMV